MTIFFVRDEYGRVNETALEERSACSSCSRWKKSPPASRSTEPAAARDRLGQCGRCQRPQGRRAARGRVVHRPAEDHRGGRNGFRRASRPRLPEERLEDLKRDGSKLSVSDSIKTHEQLLARAARDQRVECRGLAPALTDRAEIYLLTDLVADDILRAEREIGGVVAVLTEATSTKQLAPELRFKLTDLDRQDAGHPGRDVAPVRRRARHA